MVTKYLDDHIIRAVSKDSTSIVRREKLKKRKRDIKLKVKKKKGRPQKGEIRTVKEEKRIQKECAWGWYKLHLDVPDIGIPISALVTGANAHLRDCFLPQNIDSEDIFSLMNGLLCLVTLKNLQYLILPEY